VHVAQASHYSHPACIVNTHSHTRGRAYRPQSSADASRAREALSALYGAGDAFFALAAPLVAKGSDPFLAAFIGNAVGAMKVRIVGQRHQITKPEILKYLSTLLK
jgi:bifunctional ADP-heptose synthase (sugar kinase/adenylyltransferase)